MITDNISTYRGIEITVTDWGAVFTYNGSPVRTASLASAMQVIDCLIDYDARHADPIVEV